MFKRLFCCSLLIFSILVALMLWFFPFASCNFINICLFFFVFALKSTWAEDQAVDILRCRCVSLTAGWVWWMPPHKGMHTCVLGVFNVFSYIFSTLLFLTYDKSLLMDYKCCMNVYYMTILYSLNSNNAFGKLNIPKPQSSTSERRTSFFGK